MLVDGIRPRPLPIAVNHVVSILGARSPNELMPL